MRWNLNEVIEIKYTKERIYWVKLDDGACGEICLDEYVTPGTVFEPLKNVDYFRSAQIEGGTIAWPNGAILLPKPCMKNWKN